MLNLNRSHELIELNCRQWWGDKEAAQPEEQQPAAELFLPFEQYNHHRDSALAPASVFFVIELV